MGEVLVRWPARMAEEVVILWQCLYVLQNYRDLVQCQYRRYSGCVCTQEYRKTYFCMYVGIQATNWVACVCTYKQEYHVGKGDDLNVDATQIQGCICLQGYRITKKVQKQVQHLYPYVEVQNDHVDTGLHLSVGIWDSQVCIEVGSTSVSLCMNTGEPHGYRGSVCMQEYRITMQVQRLYL